MNNLFGTICLSDIDQSLIRTAENGKQYLTINIRVRKTPDQNGNEYFISSYRPKPTDGTPLPPPNYIGSAKISKYQGQSEVTTQTAPQPTVATEQTPTPEPAYKQFQQKPTQTTLLPPPRYVNEDGMPF